MAVTPHVAGLATIKIDDFTGPGLQTLGYTRDGAEMSEETFWGDVPGDERGGEQGPPIDIQYFGAIARVRLELTKWDSAVQALIEAAVPGGTAGSPMVIDPGTLIFTAGKHFRLLISTPTDPRNFLLAIPRMPRELNKGTKFSTLVTEWECHADPNNGNVLWNTTTA